MSKDAQLRKVIEAITENPALTPDGWVRTVVFADFEESSRGTRAFVYMNDGKARPALPRDPKLLDLVEALRDEMAKSTKKQAWLSAAFIIDNDDDEIRTNVKFDYDSSERWRVKADTREAIIAEFKPTK